VNATRRPCSIDGCDAPIVGWGWCSTHYARWRKTGSVELRERVQADCAVSGCDRKAVARGWCNSHWSRWKRTGDPGPAFPARVRPTRCAVDGCETPPRPLGLCDTHYARKRKRGTTDLPSQPTEYERFMAMVDNSAGEDGCHLWTGRRLPLRGGSYGIFVATRRHGGTTRAHRWLLGHLRGRPLEPDELALHHCDNPPCVNPKHLYVGDAAQNMRDCVDRGRHHQASKTHCKRNHEFTPENTRLDAAGHRWCRACTRIANQKRRLKED
jgi:hypothetical protein